MADWTLFAAVGIGVLLILAWIGSEEKRRQWRRALRRRRCAHPHPCLDGTYRAGEPGWAREVYYCPDCKHLWSHRIRVEDKEWARLSDREPGQAFPQRVRPSAKQQDQE